MVRKRGDTESTKELADSIAATAGKEIEEEPDSRVRFHAAEPGVQQ